MSFTGKYLQETRENYEIFMRKLGFPEEQIQLCKDLKSISEIEENGDHFKITVTTGTHVSVVSFTIGQECEMEYMTGGKFKTLVKREGNKLINDMKGIESVTELVDANTLVNTMTLGDMKCKTISKRI